MGPFELYGFQFGVGQFRLFRSVAETSAAPGTVRDGNEASGIEEEGAAARDESKDIFTIEWTDDRRGDAEERFVTVGMVEGRLLFVAYMLPGERIRIISAREAEPRERPRYHNENET